MFLLRNLDPRREVLGFWAEKFSKVIFHLLGRYFWSMVLRVSFRGCFFGVTGKNSGFF